MMKYKLDSSSGMMSATDLRGRPLLIAPSSGLVSPLACLLCLITAAVVPAGRPRPDPRLCEANGVRTARGCLTGRAGDTMVGESGLAGVACGVCPSSSCIIDKAAFAAAAAERDRRPPP